MSYLSLKKTKLGLEYLIQFLNGFLKRNWYKQPNEMKKITEMSGLNIVNAQMWLDQENILSNILDL